MSYNRKKPNRKTNKKKVKNLRTKLESFQIDFHRSQYSSAQEVRFASFGEERKFIENPQLSNVGVAQVVYNELNIPRQVSGPLYESQLSQGDMFNLGIHDYIPGKDPFSDIDFDESLLD